MSLDRAHPINPRSTEQAKNDGSPVFQAVTAAAATAVIVPA
jgi:hypothetical protein